MSLGSPLRTSCSPVSCSGQPDRRGEDGCCSWTSSLRRPTLCPATRGRTGSGLFPSSRELRGSAALTHRQRSSHVGWTLYEFWSLDQGTSTVAVFQTVPGANFVRIFDNCTERLDQIGFTIWVILHEIHKIPLSQLCLLLGQCSDAFSGWVTSLAH